MTKRLTSLRDLPQDVTPPRDLWPAIEATLQNEPRRKGLTRLRPSGLQVAALAAVISALAVGIWIGRVLLPTNPVAPAGVVNGTQQAANVASNSRQDAVPAAFVTDPRYLRQRAALIRAHEAELERLPPETRAKVAASLASIRQSMKEIEAALGRDPSNALLQELLLNTYQDEMRVLTTVQEAGSREI